MKAQERIFHLLGTAFAVAWEIGITEARVRA